MRGLCVFLVLFLSILGCSNTENREWKASICSHKGEHMGLKRGGESTFILVSQRVQDWRKGNAYIMPKLARGRVVKTQNFWGDEYFKWEGLEVKVERTSLLNVTTGEKSRIYLSAKADEFVRISFEVKSEEYPDIREFGVVYSADKGQFVNPDWVCMEATQDDWKVLFRGDV